MHRDIVDNTWKQGIGILNTEWAVISQSKSDVATSNAGVAITFCPRNFKID